MYLLIVHLCVYSDGLFQELTNITKKLKKNKNALGCDTILAHSTHRAFS